MRGQCNPNSRKRWRAVRELSEKLRHPATQNPSTPPLLTHLRQLSLPHRSHIDKAAQIDKAKHEDPSEWPPITPPL